VLLILEVIVPPCLDEDNTLNRLALELFDPLFSLSIFNFLSKGE